MLKGYKILTSFCVICATLYGGAYGAASVRGGATSRAGSIRTLGAGTTASVKATTSRTQPTTTAANANTESTESVGGMRMSHATGLSGTKLPGKVSGTSTSSTASNQNVAELRQAIEQLRNDYDALGEQYNNLLGDVSNVSDTAQVAHETATNNTNTLTVVRSDLSVAKSDIEDLKATGGFDEERVQEALDTTLAQRNYATRGELAATDAVARGAVQVADLPQTLNALNIADKDYVASRTQGVVNDSLNITLENYYTKKQVNDAIDVAKTDMVDKQYVYHMVDGLAPKTYVDNRVASIQTGVSEGAVQGIINNSIDTRLENYYTKGDIDNAIGDAIDAAKDGMANRDFVNTQVRDTMQYVDQKIAEKESGVDEGTLYNILETRGYKTDTEVRGIVNDSINNTMANYYTKDQVENAIDTAKKRMVDQNYVDFMVDGLVDESRVNTIVNTKIATLPLGLDQNAVKAVVEEYGYKDEAGVQEMINASGYVKTSELPDLVKQWAPGAEIQYADGKLYFVDKDGNDRVVDIRGLDGQDGDQVELQRNGDAIVWRYVSGDDQSWHNLVNMSDLRGADGKSVELGVMNNNLVWKKEGESGWQNLYDLGSITGTDGCGVKAETTNTANGMMVKLLKDCAGQTGDGQLLTQFEVLNGADGTVSEEEIVAALESNPTFMQLKNKVNNLSDGLNSTNSQVNELSDKVDNNTTGLSATNALANKAWDKVKDLESINKTAREYVDDRIGDLGYNSSLYPPTKFASVADKLGDVGRMQTVAEYIRDQVSKVNTSIEIKRDSSGYAYICNTGRCTGDPYPNSSDWTRISMDLTEYLTKDEANDLYAQSSLVSAVDTAQSAATQAQTQASQSWGKLSNLGNLTVKDYVDNYVGDVVGNLGFNVYANKAYNVADKIGIPGTDTVKKYIDDKLATVNTKIQVAQYNGQTYFCKKGTCTTPPGPLYPEDWAQITVDMSGYLTENDADKLYAPVGTVATANEAKTAANTAQTSATQAQSVASAAQSKANDAWGKLYGLSGTVKEYVDEKVGSNSLSIRVETSTDGYTYICTASNADCRDGPSQGSPYWNKIDFTIPSEYLTESKGDERYALKTQIGDLGGSFASVGAKIGLNDYQYGNTTVKDYVDNKVSNISTTIQVQTSRVDGFTYICEKGSGCTGEPSADPSQWAKVNVDLGNLGTNSYGQSYNVAQKIGLTDAANLNKTVVGYIGDRIGTLGNNPSTGAEYSVRDYLTANYAPLTKIGELGAPSTYGSTPYTVETKIGLNGSNSGKTVVQYIGEQIGELGYNYSTGAQYTVRSYLEDKYALKSSIGSLGTNTYSSTPYTVETKIGLNSGNDANQTVKGYVDGKIGVLGDKYASVAAKLGDIGQSQTVAQYIQSKVEGVNTTIKIGTYNNTTYICKTGTCLTNNPDPTNYPGDFSNWVPLQVDVSGYLTQTAANDLYAAKSVESAVNNETTGLSATRTLASSASAAAATADTKAGNAATAAETAKNTANTANTTANNAWDKVKGLDEVSGLSDKTVTGYVAYRLGDITSGQTVKQYIDTHTPTITVKEGSDGNSYICTGTDCTGTPPEGSGWTKLNVDLSGVNAILAGFGGENEPETVMNYIGDMGNYKSGWQDVPYTVASKIGLDSGDDAKKSVKQYIADRLGFTGDNADKTVAQYVAEYAASGGSFNPSLLDDYATEEYVKESIGALGNFTSVADKIGYIPVTQTIQEYIDNNMPNIDVRPGTSETYKNKLYICTKSSCDIENIPGATDSGWVELDIASAIELSVYLKTADLPNQLTQSEEVNAIKSAVSTELDNKLNKTGIVLTRKGNKIMVSGGGISTPYEVAKVSDFMCASYRMEEIGSDDPDYQDGKKSFRLVCETVGEDNNN